MCLVITKRRFNRFKRFKYKYEKVNTGNGLEDLIPVWKVLTDIGRSPIYTHYVWNAGCWNRCNRDTINLPFRKLSKHERKSGIVHYGFHFFTNEHGAKNYMGTKNILGIKNSGSQSIESVVKMYVRKKDVLAISVSGSLDEASELVACQAFYKESLTS